MRFDWIIRRAGEEIIVLRANATVSINYSREKYVQVALFALLLTAKHACVAEVVISLAFLDPQQ